MKISSIYFSGYFICLLLITTCSYTHAQPGILDSTYGRNGFVLTGIISEASNAVAIQADGKIVVTGYNTLNGDNINTELGMSRYFPDGSIDTTFGYRGIVHTTYPGNFARGFDVVIQPDSKIITAGQNYSEYALARYDSNGVLDITFGSNGLVSVDVGGHPDEVRSVLLQPDGKILVSGCSRVNLMRDFSIARFESDGSFDLSFGNQGKVILSLGPTGDEMAEDMLLQPDGKIILAGHYYNINQDDFAVVRFNSDGTLDSTFGNGGIKTLALPSTPDFCNSAALQSDGKIVLGGYSLYGMDSTIVTLARLHPDGSIDSLFGTSGIAHPIYSGYDYLTQIMLDAAEKILCVGNKTFRCLNDGSLDITFGTAGIANHANRNINDLKLLTDSSIILVGVYPAPWNGNVYLTKLNSSGEVDSLFGEVEFDYGTGFDMHSGDMAILEDDKAVMIGNFESFQGPEGVVLARYDSIGHLDLSFGTNGISKVVTDALMYSFEVQDDGKFIAGGRSAQYNYGLMRFNSNGTLDSTFGVNGSVDTPVSPLLFGSQGITSLALQNDGKIVGTGYFFAGVGTVRYLADGSLDSSFAGDGIVISNFSGTNNTAYDLKVQADGKIVVAGSYLTTSNFALGIMRYNTNGTLDNSFGINGKVEITHPDGIEARHIYLQPDNKILVTGASLVFNSNEVLLLRLNSNGSMDTSFGSGGLTFVDVTQISDRGAVVLSQNDGKILVGVDYDINFSPIILRFNIDGSPDLSFGINGVASVPLYLKYTCKSVKFQSDGKIMLGGTVWNTSYEYFLLARFDSSGFVNLNEVEVIQSNYLFPNPSDGDFILKTPFKSNATIEIFNIDGKRCYSEPIYSMDRIIKTNLPPGFYVAKYLTI
ncbi:MAG: T9SS type A sorting domain-containing protein [Bacteroidetes bacterium]|nr:T9SS type A sorting domain-containing protein [Bacteroidota bacterium]